MVRSDQSSYTVINFSLVIIVIEFLSLSETSFHIWDEYLDFLNNLSIEDREASYPQSILGSILKCIEFFVCRIDLFLAAFLYALVRELFLSSGYIL
jgi:hypothetical protein